MRASDGGGSGPLIPRTLGFNGGIVFDALALLGLSAYVCTLYGVFVRFYATRFARNFAVGNTPYGVLYCSLLSDFLCLVFCGCV